MTLGSLASSKITLKQVCRGICIANHSSSMKEVLGTAVIEGKRRHFFGCHNDCKVLLAFCERRFETSKVIRHSLSSEALSQPSAVGLLPPPQEGLS